MESDETVRRFALLFLFEAEENRELKRSNVVAESGGILLLSVCCFIRTELLLFINSASL